MHEVDLDNYGLRTDLIIEENVNNIHKNTYKENDVTVNNIILKKDINNKKKGKYVTISYSDITDSNNYENVLNIFIR